jgi:hypothetical protein
MLREGRNTQFLPFYRALFDDVPDLSLPGAEGRRAGFHFHKGNLPHCSIIQTVENDKIYWSPDKTCVLRVVLEAGKEGHKVLSDLSCDHCSALLDGISTDVFLTFLPPPLELHGGFLLCQLFILRTDRLQFLFPPRGVPLLSAGFNLRFE